MFVLVQVPMDWEIDPCRLRNVDVAKNKIYITYFLIRY